MPHQYALRKMPWRVVDTEGKKDIVRIVNLRSELLLKIFRHLKKDPRSSACLGLASRRLYQYHLKFHGLGVSLMQDPCFSGLRGQSCGCIHLGVLLHSWANKHVDLDNDELPLVLSIWENKLVEDDSPPPTADTLCKDLAMIQAYRKGGPKMLSFWDFKYIKERQGRWVIPFDAVEEVDSEEGQDDDEEDEDDSDVEMRG